MGACLLCSQPVLQGFGYEFQAVITCAPFKCTVKVTRMVSNDHVRITVTIGVGRCHEMVCINRDIRYVY